MPSKPKRKKLPKPSVFKNASTNQWVCEYHEYDDKGLPKARRKSFVRDLKKQDVDPTIAAQRKAALAFEKDLLADRKQNERLDRREREQTHLTPQQLREAKAAFAIFDQIPDRNKSLVDAVMVYRDHLKLAVDSPRLDECIGIFLGRKQEAAGKERLSAETYKTLKQRLNNMRKYFAKKYPNIKIGEITSKQLVEYFDQLNVAERTFGNYVSDVGNFFNDAANPKDEHRFINKNPMDGVLVHYRKFHNAGATKKTTSQRNTPKILQLDGVKQALSVAYAQRKHGFLGFTVCGLFAGIRPSEMFDLVKQSEYWERFIKLEEGLIRVDGFGKKRDQRTIVLGECAIEWLRLIQDDGLPLCFKYNPDTNNVRYANFRALAFLPEDEGQRLVDLRRAIRRGHEMTPEDETFAEACREKLYDFRDIMRHTYGTNFYYANGYDKNKTIAQMGHSADVFIEHYRGLLNHPDDHTAYFALTPNKIE